MRVLPLSIPLLALCAFAQPARAQEHGLLFVEASGAHVFTEPLATLPENARHAGAGGVGLNVTVGRQALPWLAVTGGVGVIQVDETRLGVSIPEDRWAVDGATHALLMGGVRLSPPVRFGLVPALELGTGVGWLHWGDQHVTSSFFSDGQRTIPGDRDTSWGWSAGLHLRLATQRHMPLPQATLRTFAFSERGAPVRMTMLELGLHY